MENNNNEINLNEEFKFVRRVLGLSQVDFAKLIGCSSTCINAIEKGKKIERNMLAKTYVSFMVVLDWAKNDKSLLREEEIYTINSFQDMLIAELNRTARDYRLILKR